MDEREQKYKNDSQEWLRKVADLEKRITSGEVTLKTVDAFKEFYLEFKSLRDDYIAFVLSAPKESLIKDMKEQESFRTFETMQYYIQILYNYYVIDQIKTDDASFQVAWADFYAILSFKKMYAKAALIKEFGVEDVNKEKYQRIENIVMGVDQEGNFHQNKSSLYRMENREVAVDSFKKEKQKESLEEETKVREEVSERKDSPIIIGNNNTVIISNDQETKDTNENSMLDFDYFLSLQSIEEQKNYLQSLIKNMKDSSTISIATYNQCCALLKDLKKKQMKIFKAKTNMESRAKGSPTISALEERSQDVILDYDYFISLQTVNERKNYLQTLIKNIERKANEVVAGINDTSDEIKAIPTIYTSQYNQYRALLSCLVKKQAEDLEVIDLEQEDFEQKELEAEQAILSYIESSKELNMLKEQKEKIEQALKVTRPPLEMYKKYEEIYKEYEERKAVKEAKQRVVANNPLIVSKSEAAILEEIKFVQDCCVKNKYTKKVIKFLRNRLYKLNRENYNVFMAKLRVFVKTREKFVKAYRTLFYDEEEYNKRQDYLNSNKWETMESAQQLTEKYKDFLDTSEMVEKPKQKTKQVSLIKVLQFSLKIKSKKTKNKKKINNQVKEESFEIADRLIEEIAEANLEEQTQEQAIENSRSNSFYEFTEKIEKVYASIDDMSLSDLENVFLYSCNPYLNEWEKESSEYIYFVEVICNLNKIYKKLTVGADCSLLVSIKKTLESTIAIDKEANKSIFKNKKKKAKDAKKIEKYMNLLDYINGQMDVKTNIEFASLEKNVSVADQNNLEFAESYPCLCDVTDYIPTKDGYDIVCTKCGRIIEHVVLENFGDAISTGSGERDEEVYKR